MKVSDFLAEPFTDSIRLRYGPGVDDAIEIDTRMFERRKQEIRNFCVGLQDADGASWYLLRAYTEQNGTHAKILIALGELAGAWQMWPPPNLSDLWGDVRAYPTVLNGSVQRQLQRGSVPKPSRGDFESSSTTCPCCGRDMGPANSRVHDIVVGDGGDLCSECEIYCEEDDCRVAPQELSVAQKRLLQEKAEMQRRISSEKPEFPDDGPPDDLEVDFNVAKYLQNMK